MDIDSSQFFAVIVSIRFNMEHVLNVHKIRFVDPSNIHLIASIQ